MRADATAEHYEIDDESPDDNLPVTVRRYDLERLKVVRYTSWKDGKTYDVLVPFAYVGPCEKHEDCTGSEAHEDYGRQCRKGAWPHPAKDYQPWFYNSIPDMIRNTGADLDLMFTSANIMTRAEAYEVVGRYHGFGNLDHEPSRMTMREFSRIRPRLYMYYYGTNNLPEYQCTTISFHSGYQQLVYGSNVFDDRIADAIRAAEAFAVECARMARMFRVRYLPVFAPETTDTPRLTPRPVMPILLVRSRGQAPRKAK